jgi:hypothetical protein
MAPKYRVKILIQDRDGYLSERVVGVKERRLSKDRAAKVARRLERAGYVARVDG